MKEPSGLSGFVIPAKLRFIDFATLSTASSCPITYFLISEAIPATLALSSDCNFLAGIPVIIDTTSATSSLVRL